MKKITLLCAVLLALTGCGGGGGSPGTCNGSAQVCFPPVETTPPPPPTAVSVDSLANICTPIGEKNWIRAHLNDVYLWYNEIVDVIAPDYPEPSDYFYALLVGSKDRFSFTVSQSFIDKYFATGEGVGYGATFATVNNRIRVTYTQPNSPAALQNLMRGAEIVGINGLPLSEVDPVVKSAALNPAKAGTTVSFQVLDVGSTVPRTIPLTSATINKYPVPTSRVITTADNKKIGYMVFTDHIVSAEAPLIDTMTQFQQSGVSDLVLDVRYNGGGYLYIASELAYMIGGSSVKGKVFEQERFNAKHPEKTNDPRATEYFRDVSLDNKPLPQLNLKRVFVLTGPGTCSASEAIINGLSPLVEVVTIGGTTCGKPYGFFQKNNCSQAYFAIEMDGLNSAGQGGYVNGFAPTCSGTDDLEHQLGDENEQLLSKALAYSKTGSCPASDLKQSKAVRDALEVRELYVPPWRDNRFLK